jgi:hypothetical protein
MKPPQPALPQPALPQPALPALPPFRSSMEGFPDHVKAIGMINIEVGNLDIFLGFLFAAILRITPWVGKEIFLTPKSAFGRLDLLKTAINEMIEDKSDGRKMLESIHGRALGIVDRRHKMIHDSWGINRDGTVVRQPIRGNVEMTPVPLKELEKMISDVRNLIDTVRFHTAKLRSDASGTKEG